MDNKELEKQAIKELLQEAKRGKQRSKTMGPSGWRKNIIPMANKQFLRKTVASSLYSHKLADNRVKRKKDCAIGSNKSSFSSASTASDINEESRTVERKTSGQKETKRIMQMRPKPYAVPKSRQHKGLDKSPRQNNNEKLPH